MVVIQEGVAAGGGDGVELMVGKAAAEVAAGGGQDAVFHLVPNVREKRSVFGVIGAQAVDLVTKCLGGFTKGLGSGGKGLGLYSFSPAHV